MYMYDVRKKARNWLCSSTLTSFRAMLKEVKLTDEDAAILDMRFIKGLSIAQIASKTNCSIEKVNKVIRQSYDKIAKLI